MDNDTRYEPIDRVLPAVMPAISRAEILPYYLRLVRVFGKLADIPDNVQEKRGFRPITSNRTRARTCWASTKSTSGPLKGWGRMIHDASHYVFEKRHPSFKVHDGGHAKLEREMAEYVVTRGWMMDVEERRMRTKPVKSSAVDKLRAVEARLAKWQSKLKRAENAIKKLKIAKRRYDKRLSASVA